MSGTVYNDNFYVGVASLEESLAANPSYVCCSFVGSFHSVKIATMQIVWSWESIPNNLVGPYEFSGNSMWGSSPSVDPQNGIVYVATGNNYAIPSELDACYNSTDASLWETACDQVLAPENWVESIVALDVNTGNKIWARRINAYDAWTVACFSPGATNCPPSPGPDADFGLAPVLSIRNNVKVLYVAQKNGVVHCLNAKVL